MAVLPKLKRFQYLKTLKFRRRPFYALFLVDRLPPGRYNIEEISMFNFLLMHMKFGLDANCDTAYTDGEVINFSPKFLDELSDRELDFVMMHEIMHVALKHCYRGKKADDFLFNVACDIVVNSNILYSNNMDINSITLKNYGESMHLIDKQEGYNFTAEEVYDKLIKNAQKQLKKSNSGSSKSSSNGTKSSNSGLQDDHSKWKEKSDHIFQS